MLSVLYGWCLQLLIWLQASKIASNCCIHIFQWLTLYPNEQNHCFLFETPMRTLEAILGIFLMLLKANNTWTLLMTQVVSEILCSDRIYRRIEDVS